ncbi:MAG: tRNA 4-thiouridine(8) synthase ThiI [Clostridia bacterium]|nr:tRNA 4-thiouridine(8) synthase ThiI [Clostridia bacterium]
MNEIILCKYGEIVLKGANRKFFETLLLREVKRRMSLYGAAEVRASQSTISIDPIVGEGEGKTASEPFDMDGAYEEAKKIFGLVGVSRALKVEKNMDAITAGLTEWIPSHLAGMKTFKVEAKRSDKTFPLNSPELCDACGGVILSVLPHIRVNVHNPDVVVRVEIRDTAAYIHAGQDKGAGGMPVGSAGRALLLLSGGIDSPVAGYMMAKRGVCIEALHFESFPYTSDRAREKVVELAKKMSLYCGEIHLHVISVTKIQEAINEMCEEDYFTLLLRRFMMRLACLCADKYQCGALVTGESLGQVASQTMEALGVTNVIADRPVFRPCIGMDKEEIIEISRRIQTFATSIEPYEDCCTVFTPRHPRTKPVLWKVEREENKLNVDTLVKEAFETLYTIKISRGEAVSDRKPAINAD